MGRIDCSDDMLFEKTVSGQTKFTGHVFEVEVKTITTPEGATACREIVKHNGGAAILPVDTELNCYLVKQFRSPFEKIMTEAPAGKVEPGEDPLVCAAREITEETGYTAESWSNIGLFYSAAAYSDERITMYLAEGLKKGEQKLDRDEFLNVIEIPLEEAVKQVLEGRITDSKTQVGIMKAAMILKERK